MSNCYVKKRTRAAGLHPPLLRYTVLYFRTFSASGTICSNNAETFTCRGKRDTATFRRLYDKVKHLTNCTFYTDGWDAFAKVLPMERHGVGKKHTICIEQDNSNVRHHLGRFTRKTKVVSKCKQMVEISLRIWHTITTTNALQMLQNKIKSIFK